MKGKVCLVTGATSGIGFEAAKALAESGAQVAIVGRDPARGADAVEQVRKIAPDGCVRLYRCDLSLLSGVCRLAQQFRSDYSRLDVLINNAGVMLAERTLTADGYETTFATNQLAPFLLTLELMPMLENSTPSRIVIVASEGHKVASLALDDLQGERGYKMIRQYARSKTANLLFCYELARKLRTKGSRVTVNAVNPGLVRTRSLRNAGIIGKLLQAFYVLPFGQSPRAGADSLVWAATAPVLESTSGQYFSKREPIRSSPETYDPTTAERLWNECARLTAAPAI